MDLFGLGGKFEFSAGVGLFSRGFLWRQTQRSRRNRRILPLIRNLCQNHLKINKIIEPIMKLIYLFFGIVRLVGWNFRQRQIFLLEKRLVHFNLKTMLQFINSNKTYFFIRQFQVLLRLYQLILNHAHLTRSLPLLMNCTPHLKPHLLLVLPQRIVASFKRSKN